MQSASRLYVSQNGAYDSVDKQSMTDIGWYDFAPERATEMENPPPEEWVLDLRHIVGGGAGGPQELQGVHTNVWPQPPPPPVVPPPGIPGSVISRTFSTSSS
jgi:hypothetical protein